MLGTLPLLMLVTSPPALAAEAERHLALLISNHEGFDGTVPLRYVAEDIHRTERVLERQGGYRSIDVWKVDDATPAFLRARLYEMASTVHGLHAQDIRVSLYVYYSGHADPAQMQLGHHAFLWTDLRQALARVGADETIVVVDACNSGGLVGEKGLRHVDAPLPTIALDLTGEDLAIVTSSSPTQGSREDPALRGSVFTHFFTLGQWGAADADNDGLVTLREAHGWSAGWLDEWTRLQGYAPQDPQLRAADPDQVIADLARGSAATLSLATAAPGSYDIYDGRTGALILPVEVMPNSAPLPLPPGHYVVQRRAAYGGARADLNLGAAEQLSLHDDDFAPAYGNSDITKGRLAELRRRLSVVDVSLAATAGAGTWLDQDVHKGYFPNALTGGAQARVVWPAGLYWTVDAWGGGGRGTVQAPTADGGWDEQSWRRWSIRTVGGGLGAGFMTHTPVFRVGGGLHFEAFGLDRRLSDGAWSLGDGDDATAPLVIVAPGLSTFVGIHDGRSELDLVLRSHLYPYAIEPGGAHLDNVGTTQALLTLGWRL